MDSEYSGPEFDFDRIIKDLMNKVKGAVHLLRHFKISLIFDNWAKKNVCKNHFILIIFK